MVNKMSDVFQSYHPLNNFLFFTLMIGFSMMLNHPLAQMISLFSALFYAIQCEGGKAVQLSLKFCLPMLLLTASPNLVNPKRRLLKTIPSGKIHHWR